VRLKFLSPEELEKIENIQTLLNELEVAVENKVKAGFKNKRIYDRSNKNT
ncbi:MAG: hypothetical protein RBG13Loki_2409, partial [Promethearchaeota archaeon CR_4]